MSDKKIEKAVELALRDENLSDYKIKEHGGTSKGEGYLGNISFITVTGTNQKGDPKTLDLVIKTSKESQALRQQTPIKEVFVKEIFIYSRVLKAFEDLQRQRGVQDLLDFLPHCYATEISDNSELLVLENVKSLGYSTCDRMVPMSHEHIELVLEAYGQWNALSLALRKSKREFWDDLVIDNLNMFSEFLTRTNMVGLVLELFEESRDACVGQNETALLEKLMISESDVSYILTDLFLEDPEHSVISHGDGWNNNFMFKSKNNSKDPESVCILDWQCSGLSSPVMDLSHFIYACCDTEVYKDVSELLKLYHRSLRKSLELLGFDAEEVFPYARLVEHWKRFSKYGLLLQPFVLKFATCDEQEAPDFAEAAEQGRAFLDNFNVDINNKEEYYRRVRANLVHYVTNLEICI